MIPVSLSVASGFALRASANASPANRRSEPVCVGVPLPPAFCGNARGLLLHDDANRTIPCQATVLEKWHDGSARWLLVEFQAEVCGTFGTFYLTRSRER